jgi:hypothetical protein
MYNSPGDYDNVDGSVTDDFRMTPRPDQVHEHHHVAAGFIGEEAGPLAPGVAGGAWSSVILDEQVELLSLIGDVALKDGEPQVHAHAVVGKRDSTAHGGHLLQARVRPTCELVLTESPAHLKKEFDPVAGIALIKL